MKIQDQNNTKIMQFTVIYSKTPNSPEKEPEGKKEPTSKKMNPWQFEQPKVCQNLLQDI